MKVETRATEKVTKEEKVLTISESEIKEIFSEAAAEVMSTDSKVIDDPALSLLLTMQYAQLCASIHHRLFNNEEEEN